MASGDEGDRLLTAPATEAAKLWDGWVTALKPAFEILVLALKPLDGTFAANAWEDGVWGVNVERARIGTEARPHVTSDRRLPHHTYGPGLGGSKSEGVTTNGRWPANVVLDRESARMLDEQSGERASSAKSNGTRR